MTEHDLEAMAREHAPFLRRLAFALVGEDAAADDLVQETWLAAARARGEAVRSPRAWLAGTTRRLAAGWRRARTARPEAPLGAEPTGPAPEPSEVAEALDAERALIAALGDLEEPFRSAVWMRYREGLAPPEIAARLGVPLETVRSRLRRGLARLRERLDAGTGERGQHALLLAPLIDGTPFRKSIAAGAAVPPLVATVAMKKLLPIAALAVVAVLGFLSRDLLLGRTERPDPREGGSELARIDGDAQPEPSSIEGVDAAGAERVEARAGAALPAPKVEQGQWVLTVRVVDEAGASIPHHPVRLLGVVDERQKFTPLVAVTDAAGTAVIDGLPLGVFRVEPDGGDRYPAARPIRATEFEDQDVEVTLFGAVRVRGIVRDPDGEPVQGAGLHASWNAMLGPLPIAVSDGAGRLSARIGGRFSIAAPGFLRTDQIFPRDLPVDEDGVRTFDVTLERSGRRLAGLVVDRTGDPVPFAYVSASEARASERPGVVYDLRSTAIADDAGRFDFPHGFRGESAQLVVLARGFAPSQSWLDAGDDWEDQTVVLGGGRTLRVAVQDGGGNPLAAAKVEAQSGRWASLDWMAGIWSMSSTTGDDGTVVLEAVPEEAVTIQASAGGWGDGPLERAVDVVEADVPDGSTVELALSSRPWVRGRVVDTDGVPVPDLLVQAFTEAGGGGEHVHLFASTTDLQGRFEFTSLLGAGAYDRRSGHWGLRVRRRDEQATVLAVARDLVPDVDGLEIVVDLDQPEPGWIEGVVATRNAAELPVGVRAVAWVEGGRATVQGTVDLGSRSFRIGPLAPGEFSVGIGSSVGDVRRTGVVVTAGATTDIGVLTLGGGPALRLVPRLRTDAPLPRGALEDLCASRRLLLTMGAGNPVPLSWLDGAWTNVAPLEPGLWRDTPRPDERLQFEPFEVRLEDGEERTLEVDVHIGCTTPLEIVAPPDEDWESLEVEARALGGGMSWTTRVAPRTRAQILAAPLEVTLPLLSTCEVRVVTNTGLVGTARVEVAVLAKRRQPVRVELVWPDAR